MNALSAFPPARRIGLASGGWLNVHEQLGAGPTLLLLHGFTDRAESYRLIVPHLAGRHLVMPDLRGHGESFRKDIHGLNDFALDIEEMSQAMGVKEIVLIGHSMGALIALHLVARANLNVLGLGMMSGSLHPASPVFAEIADSFASLPTPLLPDHSFLDDWYACSRPVPRSFIDLLKKSCVRMRPEDWVSCLAHVAGSDLHSLAQAVGIPALAISGVLDPIFTPEQQAQLQRSLNPSQVLCLADVGHNPHWEAPAEVAGAINAFVGKLDWTPN